MNDDFEVIRGSGNVFHDFGHENADLEQARAILAKEIIRMLDVSDKCSPSLTGVITRVLSAV